MDASVVVLDSKIVPRVKEASQGLARLNERATDFIRERPGASLLAAVALGFVVGKIAVRV